VKFSLRSMRRVWGDRAVPGGGWGLGLGSAVFGPGLAEAWSW
jgi:hypothetical protein